MPVLACVGSGRYCKSVFVYLSDDDIQFSLPRCRYRNFRTFTSPRAVQFSCLTVDSSGEVVCSGSLDTFEVFVWSIKTGRLLEVILCTSEIKTLILYKIIILVVQVFKITGREKSNIRLK